MIIPLNLAGEVSLTLDLRWKNGRLSFFSLRTIGSGQVPGPAHTVHTHRGASSLPNEHVLGLWEDPGEPGIWP